MNGIGKFEMREIIDKVDAALIDGFGMNMCDAGISRHEAISAYNEVNCPRQAAALCARRHGIAPQSV